MTSRGYDCRRGVQERLTESLDKQDTGTPTDAERHEADGSVDLAELLSLLRLRSERTSSRAVKMMGHSADLRRQVIERAANCCEHRGRLRRAEEATFHVDDVVPVVAGRKINLGNLALACVLMFAQKRRSPG